MRIGRNIKQMREKRGLTQQELCEAAGVTQAYLSRLETGVDRNPTINLLQSIATCLKTTVGKLIKE